MSESELSSVAVRAAKPTIRADEQAHDKLTELLIAMEMKEQESGLSSIELRFSNVASTDEGISELAFEDESILRLGTLLTVYSGDENAPQEIFRGIITGLEADFPNSDPPELVVLAEDVLQKSRMMRRTAIHEETSIAAIAQNIAAAIGVTPRITELDDSIGTWCQFNESDLMFLRRLLSRSDADVQIIGDEIFVYRRNEMQRQIVELELHSQLRNVRILADLSDQVTEVTVTGWDINQGEKISAASTGANEGPGSGRSGAELLRDAIGERSEHIGHLCVNNQEEAQLLADSAYDQLARRFVCVEGTAEGNPAIRVGSNVALSGISSRFDNTYYVTAACHRFDVKQGYETDFEAVSGKFQYA